MDALSAILHTLRLSSTLISRARFSAPWAVKTGALPGSIFHAIVEGHCHARVDGEEGTLALGPGDVVVFTHGSGHIMADDPQTPSVPILSVSTESDGGYVGKVTFGGGGAVTRIICGQLKLAHPASASAWSLLPPVMVVRAGQVRLGEWLNTTLELMEGELETKRPGSQEVVSRLLDILLVQVLRQLALDLPEGAGGWLGAMRDPQIAEAVALIHADPGARWTATRLASRVGMSRSVFFSRFSKLVGEPPGQYVTRWRMHTAADLIATYDLSTAELAEKVGYASEDAFSKAFSREVGITPAVYRRRVRVGHVN